VNDYHYSPIAGIRGIESLIFDIKQLITVYVLSYRNLSGTANNVILRLWQRNKCRI